MTEATKKKTYNGDVRIELNKLWTTSHVYINDVEIPVESLEIKFDGSIRPHNPLMKVKLGLHLDLLKFALKNASIEVSEGQSTDFGKMFELLVTSTEEAETDEKDQEKQS